MAHYKPATLAKTLSYILCVSPAEHGLFWNPDGTMPWKEFYWALQEDSSLRFVREVHLREINFLGIDFPAVLEGNLLRLREHASVSPPATPGEIPGRLFIACPRRSYLSTLEHGLKAARRPYVALFSREDLALRVGKRRDPQAILVEVLGRQAGTEGVVFCKSGDGLYLTEHVPPKYILPPKLKESVLLELANMGKKTKKEDRGSGDTMPHPHAPGSFFVEPRHLGAPPPKSSTQDRKQKEKRGADWKRASRKDRGKRSV